jgi:hypothetical protein
MTTIPAARALVASLYDSGDLSHDQANPILCALLDAEQAACTLAPLLWLLAAGCRLSLYQHPDAVTLTISRPGAPLIGDDGGAYTLFVRQPTLGAALTTAAAWLAKEGTPVGAGEAEALVGDTG